MHLSRAVCSRDLEIAVIRALEAGSAVALPEASAPAAKNFNLGYDSRLAPKDS
jgi:hypothetical protein